MNMDQLSDKLTPKIVFIGHYILITCSLGQWAPTGAILFYNSVFMALLAWGIFDGESTEQLNLAQMFNLFACFFDLFIICTYFPTRYDRALQKLSAAMAIFNLFWRGLTYVTVQKELRRRRGPDESPESFGRQYQNIDEPTKTPFYNPNV